MITKILCRKFGKRFLELKKMLQENPPALPPPEFFMFYVYNIQEVITRPFSFNLKSICTWEFFKKLKLHSPKRLVQFLLFEKFTAGANLFQIEQETIWLLISINSVMFLRRPFYILTIYSTFEWLSPNDQVESKNFLLTQAIYTGHGVRRVSIHGNCTLKACAAVPLKHIMTEVKPQFTNHLFAFFYPSEGVNNLKET